MTMGLERPAACPYFFCSARLITVTTKRQYEDTDIVSMIPLHELRNEMLPPENCPASLMTLPLTQEEINLLNARERADYRRIIDREREQIRREGERPIAPPLPPTSKSMLPEPGSRRFGRTPATEGDQKDWLLGGRKDEDVQQDPQIHPIPPTQLGYPMKGRSNQMSVASVKAQIAAANAEASGSHAALGEAVDPNIHAALASIEDALVQYTANAYAGLENAAAAIAAANEDGSDTLGGVHAQYQQIQNDLQTVRGGLQRVKAILQATIREIGDIQSDTMANIEAAEEYARNLRG